MTGEDNPDDGALVRFLADWTALWREELQAQAKDPATGELWRAATAFWANAFDPSVPAPSVPAPSFPTPTAKQQRPANPASHDAPPGTSTTAPRAAAAHASFDPRDAAIERLNRRIDELEARIVERRGAPRRRRVQAAFLRGIRAWHAHPWRRALPDPPTVWQEGDARLLDFGGAGPLVLFVPSLVNRWTVLDLMEGHSLLRWLAAEGVHPLLLDWGTPEATFTLTDHIAGRLTRAMESVGEKMVLAGYCMGGTFAVAAATLRPDLVSRLVLLATPWDFHAGGTANLHLASSVLEPMLRDAATVPVDLIQALFALDNPGAVAEKFRRFSRLDPDSQSANLFVAVEDWLNDGVPLSGTTARECMRDWYRDNLPFKRQWMIGGRPVDPAMIRIPSLIAVPQRDRIVPPRAAQPLARLIPKATLLEPPAGHVGMIAGPSARSLFWKPLREWLRDVPTEPKRRRRRTPIA